MVTEILHSTVKSAFILIQVLLILLWRAVCWFIPRRLTKSKVIELQAELVLITGAGNGLGRALAISFAKLGASLVLWDIDQDGVRSVADEVATYGSHAYPYLCDCSDREAVFRTAEKVKKEVGNISVIVNNAGIVVGKSIMEIDPIKFDKVMQVNAMAHFWTTKAFLPWMLENNFGYILNVASIAAFKGAVKASAYCASKAAAVSFSDSLRSELKAMKKTGIHITCVCPGWIDTGMFSGIKFPFGPYTPDYVANEAVDAMMQNKFIAIVPAYLYPLVLLQSVLPTPVMDIFDDLFNLHQTMDTFVGNKKL